MKIKSVFIFFFFFFFISKIFSQCIIVKSDESEISRELEKALKAVPNDLCMNWKTINITKDYTTDQWQIRQEIKNASAFFAIGYEPANLIVDLRHPKKIGFFLPESQKFLKKMDVVSIYPEFSKVINFLKEKNYKNMLLLFSKGSASDAFLIHLKAKEMGANFDPFELNSIIDISQKFREKIQKADGLILTIDQTFYNEEILKMILKEALEKNKLVFSFLKSFLKYGVNGVFYAEMEEIAKTGIYNLKDKDTTTYKLFQTEKVVFETNKERPPAGGFKNETF